MKKCITTLASLIIAVCCSLAIAGGSKPASSAAVNNAKVSTQTCPLTATTPATTAATKKAPSFLFVIEAKQGKIETKNGKTYLVLQKTVDWLGCDESKSDTNCGGNEEPDGEI